MEAVRDALTAQMQRLGSQALDRLLAQSGAEHVDTLLKAAQAGDLSALAHILDDRLVEFIRSFLTES